MTKKEENDLKKVMIKEVKEKVLLDIDKEINHIMAKNGEDLKKEISEDINSEVLNAIKREEKRFLRSKNFLIFKKNIVIIGLFMALCYFGYCLYDVKYFSFMKSECEKNGTCGQVIDNSNNVINKEEVIKDKNWYIENYGYLLQDVQVLLNADQASAYYLYSNDHKVNEIKTSYLLNMAYKKVSEKDIKTNSVNISFEAETLRGAYQQLFGTLEDYQDTSFSYDCLNFIYNKDKDRYVAENHKCVEANKTILETISDMFEEDNKLYILTTATIYDKNESCYYTFDNLYDPIMVNVNETDLEENAKKLNKYQYVFKKVDDVYYLDSITKLK